MQRVGAGRAKVIADEDGGRGAHPAAEEQVEPGAVGVRGSDGTIARRMDVGVFVLPVKDESGVTGRDLDRRYDRWRRYTTERVGLRHAARDDASADNR